MSQYASAHSIDNRSGPGDNRPTALQIVQDQNLIKKLSGKVALVTGATSGIGIETARALHAAGMTVYIGSRSQEKGQKVIDDIKAKSSSDAPLEIVEMELDSLESVRQGAKSFLSRSERLDVLVTNAGVMAPPYGKTKDGFETQFGICHVGHFLLFQLLKPTLIKTAQTSDRGVRVVTLSSTGHRAGEMRFDDYNFEKEEYNPWLGYGQAKTGPLYMSNEIERRYGQRYNLHGLSLHPGLMATNLGQYLDEAAMKAWSTPAHKDYMKSHEQGAATSVYAALAKEWEGKGGVYLADCAEQGPIKSMEEPVTIFDEGYAPWAFDEGKARKLWADSCKFTGTEDDD